MKHPLLLSPFFFAILALAACDGRSSAGSPAPGVVPAMAADPPITPDNYKEETDKLEAEIDGDAK